MKFLTHAQSQKRADMRRSDKGHLTNPRQSTLPCPNPDPNLNRNPNPDPNPNTNPNPNPKCVNTVV